MGGKREARDRWRRIRQHVALGPLGDIELRLQFIALGLDPFAQRAGGVILLVHRVMALCDQQQAGRQGGCKNGDRPPARRAQASGWLAQQDGGRQEHAAAGFGHHQGQQIEAPVNPEEDGHAQQRAQGHGWPRVPVVFEGEEESGTQDR